MPEKMDRLGANYGWNDVVCAPRRVGCSKIGIKICPKKVSILSAFRLLIFNTFKVKIVL